MLERDDGGVDDVEVEIAEEVVMSKEETVVGGSAGLGTSVGKWWMINSSHLW